MNKYIHDNTKLYAVCMEQNCTIRTKLQIFEGTEEDFIAFAVQNEIDDSLLNN